MIHSVQWAFSDTYIFLYKFDQAPSYRRMHLHVTTTKKLHLLHNNMCSRLSRIMVCAYQVANRFSKRHSKQPILEPRNYPSSTTQTNDNTKNNNTGCNTHICTDTPCRRITEHLPSWLGWCIHRHLSQCMPKSTWQRYSHHNSNHISNIPIR